MTIYLAVYADTSDFFNEPLGVAATLEGARAFAATHFSDRIWEPTDEEASDIEKANYEIIEAASLAAETEQSAAQIIREAQAVLAQYPPAIRWEAYTDHDREVVQRELVEHGTLDIEKWGRGDEYAIYAFELQD